MRKIGIFLFLSFLITSVVFTYLISEKTFENNYFNIAIIGVYLSILSLGCIPKIELPWKRFIWVILTLGVVLCSFYFFSPSSISILWKPAISLILIQFGIVFFQIPLNSKMENWYSIRKYLFLIASCFSLLIIFLNYHPMLTVTYVICMLGMILLPFFESKKTL